MAHLIDKSAVLAEIDKVMAEEMKFYETACKEGDEEVSSSPMVYTRLQILRSCIDTLEVKEVDIEYIKDELNRVVKIYKPDGDFGWGTLYNIATHFFKLGMAASNKAQKGE